MRREIGIELLTDACFAASNRTTGGGATLDFIPGRVLWGAAATRGYKHLPEAEAFRLFQQGAVRFLDAVPTRAGVRAWPTPRSWHVRKRSAEGKVRNLAAGPAPEGWQPEPLPADWRMAAGEVVVVPRPYSLRTAVQAGGRARTGMLFGMEMLPAGTVFFAQVEGAEQDVEQVVVLLREAELRLGRSRGAELGRARLVDAAAGQGELPRSHAKEGREVRLLCVSRLCLRDPDTGMPTFAPRPALFGLPEGWELVLERSFVRTQRFSPFNVFRGRPELERQCLTPGSVLTFRAGPQAAAVDLDSVASRTAGGVGLYVNEGHGEVVVQPEWLEVAELQLPREEDGAGMGATPGPSTPGPVPEDELFTWANERSRARTASRDALLWAELRAQRMRKLGLRPSQWGVLHALAREARVNGWRRERLMEQVEQLVTRGVSALSGGWGKTDGAGKSGDTLLHLLRNCPGEPATGLELLASRVLRPEEEESQR